MCVCVCAAVICYTAAKAARKRGPALRVHVEAQKKGVIMEKNRYYNWRIVSYCNEEEILDFCKKWGSKWEYILHDKDVNEDGSLKEKHYHINITLKIWKSRNKVCELVGKSGNSFAIEMTDKEEAHRYLTHLGIPDKYQYEQECIKSNFKWVDSKQEKGDIENFLNIVADKKLSMKEKALMLGKDYIKNYRNYNEYVERMENEESNKNRRGGIWLIEFIKDNLNNKNLSILEIIEKAKEEWTKIREEIEEIEEEIEFEQIKIEEKKD